MIQLLLMAAMVFCMASAALARPIPPGEALDALRRAFSGIQDFTADISQEKRLSLMKRTMHMTGTVRFRKPDLFYLEIAPPYASRLVLRDTTVEQVMGSSGDRNSFLLPPQQGLRHWFSKLAAPVTAVPEGMLVRADLNAGEYTVTIMPQGEGQVRELILVFQGNGVVKRLVIVERNGDRSMMAFKRFNRNVGLTEKDFKLD